jgi:DNA-binding GntR family transcriptional regulator
MGQIYSSASDTGAYEAPRPSSFLEKGSDISETGRIHAEIFDAMMDGRLKPGAKLTESSLCAIFQCSRAVVRTALAQLARDRLVVLLPHRGAFVWLPSRKETRDVFEARRALEGVLIDLLLAQPKLAQRLAPLRKMVEREQRAYETGDRVSWLRLSHAFHVRLAQLTGNDVLVEMTHLLCARSTLIIACYDVPGAPSCSYGEHESILDLLANGDRTGVRAAMEHHLQSCEHRLRHAEEPILDPWSAFSVKPLPAGLSPTRVG